MAARDVAGKFMEAFNAHDEAGIRSLSADDATIEAPGDIKLEGAEGVTKYAMTWLNAFPDARTTVRHEMEAGDWVVQEFTFEGTHQGTLSSPAGDIPATNRSLSGRGVQLLRIQGDKLAETHLYFDQVQVMTQLGLMPEPATA